MKQSIPPGAAVLERIVRGDRHRFLPYQSARRKVRNGTPNGSFCRVPSPKVALFAEDLIAAIAAAMDKNDFSLRTASRQMLQH
jgi:hypothetical protein